MKEPEPQHAPLTVLLADDDMDDRIFFEKAIKEIPIATKLTIVYGGEELMDYLNKNSDSLPDVLFLDLAMPRKTGYECLDEIKENEKFRNIYVVIFSTSYTSGIDFEQGLKDTLFKIGADNYIRKPGDFADLKKAIHDALIKVAGKESHSKQVKY